jgi:excisionase family DNA binding protein
MLSAANKRQAWPETHNVEVEMTTTAHGAGDRNAGRKIATVEAALMDVEAVAELLSCSTRTVRRMADAGQMPRPLRIASLVRWRRSDVEAWLADGCPNCRPSNRGAGR